MYKSIILNTETEGHRISQINRNLTETMYKNISYALFNKDKRIFAFNIASLIGIKEKKQIDPAELQFFIKEKSKRNAKLLKPKAFEFSDSQWKLLNALASESDAYLPLLHSIHN